MAAWPVQVRVFGIHTVATLAPLGAETSLRASEYLFIAIALIAALAMDRHVLARSKLVQSVLPTLLGGAPAFCVQTVLLDALVWPAYFP